MPQKLLLDVPVLLPDAHDNPDGRDGCVDRLTETLGRAPGLSNVHVLEATDDAPVRLCVHYDPDATDVGRIRRLAEDAGADLTSSFGHVLWTVTGADTARRTRAVAEALRRTPGVVDAGVSTGLVRAEIDRSRIDEDGLRSVLDGLGVRPDDGAVTLAKGSGPAAAAPAAESHDHPPHDHGGEVHADHDHTGHDHGSGGGGAHDHEHGGPFGEKSELIFALLSGGLWILGLVLGIFDVDIAVRNGVFIVAGLFGGYFTLREAIDTIRAGRFEIDFLMLVAAAGAAALGKFEEGALLLALFSVGHALEGYAMGRARKAIEALAELAPTSAIIRDEAGEREVPVEDLRIGDTVVVKPNTRIPADGFVLAGTSSVDQAPLTGESIPVDKEPAEDVDRAAADPDKVPARSRLFSGTINGAGPLDLYVTKLATESTLSKLARLVREAETETSPTQRFTDRFERIFVPGVFVLVALTLFGGVLLGASWSDAFYRSMAVLVAASPCALAIATPSAVLAAVARAGQVGVLIKGGGPLENLGTLEAVAFDKTGTLTEGRPRLTDVKPAPGVTTEEILLTTVAVELRSDHPLAAAIVRDGREQLGGRQVAAADDVRSVTGKGIRAVVDGAPVLVGKVALFDDEGGVDPAVIAEVDQLQAAGRTIMIVKQGDRFLGVLGLMDTPRPVAKAAITELRAIGVERAIMLSGDHQLVAESIAKEVGLTEAWGDLMPEDKVTAVGKLRDEEGKVAMVGDGVNDAPALAHATVGIAMGAAGSDVALETADIALMGDDLAKLPEVIGLSRQASRIIRQNLYVSLGIVTFLIPATIVGFLGIGPAVVFHEGSTVVVVANALRLLAYRRKK